MVKIIAYSIILIITIISIYASIKMYKKAETITEKTLYILFIFVILVPIAVYFLDKYDVPTKIGHLNNINSNRWFNFISTYISSIVGTIVSGVILVLITMKQIQIQIESNNNDKRIQNSPILDYSLSVANNANYKYYHDVILKESGKQYHIRFKVENIGLNHCRNLNFKIKIDDEDDHEFSLNKKQSFLKKDNFVELDLVFNLDSNKKVERNISITVTYNDMLNNKYMQNIKSKLYFTRKGLSKTINVDEIIIEQEKLIEK